MPKSQVILAGILGSAVSGVVCALGLLSMVTVGAGAGRVSLSEPSAVADFLIVVFMVAGVGVVVGVVVGLVLGVLPVAVSVLTWTRLERALGTARTINLTAAQVGIISFVELSVLLMAASQLVAVGWALAGGLIATGVGWGSLRLAWRLARRLPSVASLRY